MKEVDKEKLFEEKIILVMLLGLYSTKYAFGAKCARTQCLCNKLLLSINILDTMKIGSLVSVCYVPITCLCNYPQMNYILVLHNVLDLKQTSN